MLNIWFGREDLNKDKFIYENIKGNTLIIVPDQFTLQAERDAFFYTKKQGLMDIEILSLSRFAERIFNEIGGGRTPMIDKQGRHMLLTKIMRKEKNRLSVYGNYGNNTEFIEMVNNFISEVKQHNKTPEDLRRIAGEKTEDRYLKQKLSDMEVIFSCYEQYIKGKYIDTEDKIALMTKKISQSQLVRKNTFWVYGFDYFTPKNLLVLGQIMKTALSMNLVLTLDEEGPDKELFRMGQDLIFRLKDMADQVGVETKVSPIDRSFIVERLPAVAAIEKNLFALPQKSCEAVEGLKLIKASGYYSEAESAAAEVLRLVREEGLRYRDILLICNDLSVRGNIYKRVFEQYGINIFADEKRSIIHHPAVNYILALIDIIAGGYKREDVIRLLKTGLSNLTSEEIEIFENYTVIYNVRGNLFKNDFIKGEDSYGVDGLIALNEMRKKVICSIENFKTKYLEEKTVSGKVMCLYEYLKEDCKIPEKIEEKIKKYVKEEQLESAAESARIWNITTEIFDQLINVLGEENISMKDFSAVFKSGFESVEIALLPPAGDGIIMGTMQRTRTGRIKAMMVLGANEGILPAEGDNEGILSEDEKLLLEEDMCKLGKLQTQEENLAIYRNLSKPEKLLWMSYSVCDEEGTAVRPSRIFDSVANICSKVEIKNDILTDENNLAQLTAVESGLTHITEALQNAMGDGELNDIWKDAILWYGKNEKEKLELIKDGMLFQNRAVSLDKKIAENLYKKDEGEPLSLSPSRLEKFGKCPFAHFVLYGLRPEEPRIYTVGPMEMGDMYHKCLMLLSQGLTKEGVNVTGEDSLWMKITKEECVEKVEEILDEQCKGYKEGIFENNKTESYRAKRMKELCGNAAWVMVEQVRKGSIERMDYEIPFGRGKKLDPIFVNMDGEKIYVEGIIDRIDTLPEDYVKVIDYKSGSDKYNENEALAGWKLQLLIYLRAACGTEKKPAGAFYFHIGEPEIKAETYNSDELKMKVEKELKKAFKMDGVMLDDPEIVKNMDNNIDKFSDVIPVKNSKKGISGVGKRKVLAAEEFDELMSKVSNNVDNMCRDLASGEIEIRPKRIKTSSACTYCKYKGICKFDISFSGCNYENI